LAQPKKRQNLTVSLDAEFVEEIRAAAAAQPPRGVSISAFMEFILRELLAGRVQETYEELVAQRSTSDEAPAPTSTVA